MQIIHIWDDALGGPNEYGFPNVAGAYDFIVGLLIREYGLFVLPGTDQQYPATNSPSYERSY